MMLSSTLMPLNSARFWKVRAMPISATWRLFMWLKVWPRKVILPFLRCVHAVDAVEHAALAGAVGADDGAHLVLAHVEADVGERLHAAEAQADVAHVEDDVADLAGHQAAFLRTGKVFASTMVERGAHLAGAPVLELHLRLDVLLGLAGVQRVHQHLVLVVDVAALDLAGARHLAVVGVQFLVQHQEAADLAAGQAFVLRQVGVDLLHAVASPAPAPRAWQARSV